ncbi:putative damage-inducible protein DinB [Paenibacillus shirakamiensis]|uniref:Damage-inducible protein DinB n=1 Tax=Paenibacillus shirakamiensis TaxID=1265935 RepID=A0ABS4JHE4_9BACL|nr:DinB family protein [Paenibacillus shirakamiensis]MBP2000521.1 putative damage-inducible protein DinB [Paenibacillus shirakamiensis]
MNHNTLIRNQIFELVQDLNEDQINQKPAPDKWSIAQVMDHLYLMERTIAHQIGVTIKNDVDAPTDLKPYKLTLDRTRHVDAPPNLVPSEDRLTMEHLKSELAQSREALIASLAGQDQEKLKHLSFLHPVFGMMDLTQWEDFVGIHEERHMEQIREVKNSILSAS